MRVCLGVQHRDDNTWPLDGFLAAGINWMRFQHPVVSSSSVRCPLSLCFFRRRRERKIGNAPGAASSTWKPLNEIKDGRA